MEKQFSIEILNVKIYGKRWQKLNFQQQIVFSITQSFRNHLYADLVLTKHLFIINVEKSCAD